MVESRCNLELLHEAQILFGFPSWIFVSFVVNDFQFKGINHKGHEGPRRKTGVPVRPAIYLMSFIGIMVP
jgi:hypothetical protein